LTGDDTSIVWLAGILGSGDVHPRPPDQSATGWPDDGLVVTACLFPGEGECAAAGVPDPEGVRRILVEAFIILSQG